MNYELAKQLDEAGFPQVTKNLYDVCIHGNISQPDLPHCTDGQVACPELEELIEACGFDFWCLVKKTTTEDDEDGWMARQNRGATEEGSTPTEAVARLWLALNEKKAAS